MAKPKRSMFLAKQWADGDQCIVVGAQAFILRISSFFGVAPLRFTPHGNGYLVSISKPMCIYSYLLMTFLLTIQFINIVTPNSLRWPNPIVAHSSTLYKLVGRGYTLMLYTVASAGVFGAPNRMKSMIKYMNTIASVDRVIGATYSQTQERKLFTGSILFLLNLLLSLIHELFYAVISAGSVMYAASLLEYFTVRFLTMTLVLQFALATMVVYARFKHINEALSFTARNMFTNYVSGVQPRLLISPGDSVHRIALMHGKLCDAVLQLENSFSFSLFIILLFTEYSLTILLYFAITEINQGVLSFHRYIIPKLLWFTLSLLTLLMVEEPCHYSIVEGKITVKLVSRMMIESSVDGALASRLKLFSHQLMLQPVRYKPMGICTLDRPLIATVFGTVITFLVILVQFKE